MNDDDILKPDTTVGRYAIKRLLGRGSFGVTYLAERLDPRLAVAMKEYFPLDFAERNRDGTTVNPRGTGPGGDEFNTGLRKFLEESRVLGRFDSPHVVRVVDTFEMNGTAYMVMEYEEGRTLDHLLAQRSQPLTESELLSIFIPVLEGLKDIHATWYVHRDIKPNNIYIREDGSPLLIDFGATRDALAVKRGGMTEYLTPGFAPAEQYDRSRDQGPWTDIYAVGATMYYCVTRIRPPDGRERAAGQETMMSAVEAGPSFYRAELLELIDWMMAPRAEERPQSVDRILNRLKEMRDERGGQAPTLRRAVEAGASGGKGAGMKTNRAAEAGKDSNRSDAETEVVAGPPPPPDETGRLRRRRNRLVLAGSGVALALIVLALATFLADRRQTGPDLSSVPRLDRELLYHYRLDLNARETRKGANGFFSDEGVLVTTDDRNRKYVMFDGKGFMQADDIDVDLDDFTLALWIRPQQPLASPFRSALSLHAGKTGHAGGGDRSARIRVTRARPDPVADGPAEAEVPDTASPAPYVQALLNVADGGKPDWIAAPAALDRWTHVVFTREDDTLGLYLDGEPAETLVGSAEPGESADSPGELEFTDGKIRVGASNFHGPDGDGPDGRRDMARWVGALDDVRVYSRALTETEIRTLFRD